MKESMRVTRREYTPEPAGKTPRKFMVTVKKAFLDRYTGTTRKPGDTFEVTESRYLEIKRSGADYIEAVKTAADAEKAEKPAE